MCSRKVLNQRSALLSEVHCQWRLPGVEDHCQWRLPGVALKKVLLASALLGQAVVLRLQLQLQVQLVSLGSPLVWWYRLLSQGC